MKLTVTHSELEPNSGMLRGISAGWPLVLSALKSFLETGTSTLDRRDAERAMTDITKFKPKTVYVTYIASTPEKVWQALTDPAFTRQYFGGFAIEVEPKAGGAFFLRNPDGSVHMSGRVVEWSPPRRFSCTWLIEGMPEFRELPVCLVTYEIEQPARTVKLTMTEAHSLGHPGRDPAGRAHRLAGDPLKSQERARNRKAAGREARSPPEGIVEAVKKAVAERPWLNSSS